MDASYDDMDLCSEMQTERIDSRRSSSMRASTERSTRNSTASHGGYEVSMLKRYPPRRNTQSQRALAFDPIIVGTVVNREASDSEADDGMTLGQIAASDQELSEQCLVEIPASECRRHHDHRAHPGHLESRTTILTSTSAVSSASASS